MKKISWGTRIAVLYIGFVVMMIAMVSMAMRQKVDLVSADYYEQELKFQERINQSERSKSLSTGLDWSVKSGMIEINFPPEFQSLQKSGQINFFRPSDQEKDQLISFTKDTSSVRIIPTQNLAHGVYNMQIHWVVNGVTYFNEGIVTIH